jgi:UDP-N-acetylmuramoylalanine-D-glutamate ligase
LEAQGHFTVAAACILNVSVDHLERHNSLENYARTKAKLIECMRPGSAGAIISQDVMDLCGDTTALQGCARIGSLPGVMLRRTEAQVMHRDWKRARSLDLSALQCPGQHNMLNAAVRTNLQQWSLLHSKSLSSLRSVLCNALCTLCTAKLISCLLHHSS